MALNIKDAETDRLARELAELSGTSITEALRTALTHELTVVRRRRTPTDDRRDRIQAVIDRGRARAVVATKDERSEDEILGYGPDGLPT